MSNPPSRAHGHRLLALALALALWLAACGAHTTTDRVYTIATIFPESGAEATVGLAMERGVDLAVRQHAALGNDAVLAVRHVDSQGSDAGQAAALLAADPSVMGIVGPLDSASAVRILPIIERSGLVMISPGATLPGLTQADQAVGEGLAFAQLHPAGTATAFFRLPPDANAIGAAAADFAMAPTQVHGLAAQSAVLVSDGSAVAQALATAFARELRARHGTIVGQQTITLTPQSNVQALVSAVVAANPDVIFYAGGMAGGAALRGALSLSGAPLPILVTGAIADDPTWATAVGMPAAAANTIALLAAPDLGTLAPAKAFTTAYQAAYPGAPLLPESVLAYDAAMDEMSAIAARIHAGQPVTRAAVLARVATAAYAGISGTLAFARNGDDLTRIGLSVYTCDAQGAWQYTTTVAAD